MTILPTVRDQLEQAAAEQARERSARPTRSTRVRVNPGAIVVVCCVVVAVGVAALALTLVKRQPAAPVLPVTRPANAAMVLGGDGIGNIRFGRAPAAAVHRVERLLGLGRPTQASATSSIGFTHFGCGFYQVYWTGLAATPTRVLHSTGLTLWFKRSRFAGYTYGSPSGGPTTPVVRNGPRFSTAAGLGLREPLSRARYLYGNDFVITSTPQGTPPNPRLPSLPSWKLQTVSGRIYGAIDTPARPPSAAGGTIGSINAGTVPNTPCH